MMSEDNDSDLVNEAEHEVEQDTDTAEMAELATILETIAREEQ